MIWVGKMQKYSIPRSDFQLPFHPRCGVFQSTLSFMLPNSQSYCNLERIRSPNSPLVFNNGHDVETIAKQHALNSPFFPRNFQQFEEFKCPTTLNFSIWSICSRVHQLNGWLLCKQCIACIRGVCVITLGTKNDKSSFCCYIFFFP